MHVLFRSTLNSGSHYTNTESLSHTPHTLIHVRVSVAYAAIDQISVRGG